MIDSLPANPDNNPVINRENIKFLFDAILALQARVKELES